jgi:phosphate uptake regulator
MPTSTAHARILESFTDLQPTAAQRVRRLEREIDTLLRRLDRLARRLEQERDTLDHSDAWKGAS